MTLDINRPDLMVGVVGTGAMGRGIAQVTAQGGIKAIMFDAAAGGDRGQLGRVAHQQHLRTRLPRNGGEAVEFEGGGHGGFVHDDELPGA